MKKKTKTKKKKKMKKKKIYMTQSIAKYINNWQQHAIPILVWP